MSQKFLKFNYKALYICLESQRYLILKNIVWSLLIYAIWQILCRGYETFGMRNRSFSRHVIEILLIHLKQYFLSLNFFCRMSLDFFGTSPLTFFYHTMRRALSLINLKTNFLCREMFMNNYFYCIYCSGWYSITERT